MSYSFSWENNGVYWKYEGILDISKLIHANAELIGNKQIEDISYIIWDASAINAENLDDEEAIEISATFSKAVDALNSHIKVAFIALDEHLRALINQYLEQNLKQIPHAKLKLFDKLDNARNWIASE